MGAFIVLNFSQEGNLGHRLYKIRIVKTKLIPNMATVVDFLKWRITNSIDFYTFMYKFLDKVWEVEAMIVPFYKREPLHV